MCAGNQGLRIGSRVRPRARVASHQASLYANLVSGVPARHITPGGTSPRATTRMRIWPGSPYPLGARWDGEGVNFALFSDNATAVELCLFDDRRGGKDTHRIRLEECTDQVWHVYLPEVRPGQHYGYRVHGPYEPEAGHRFNPAKLLLDPYAKAINGTIHWSDALFGYRIGDPHADLSLDEQDNAGSIRNAWWSIRHSPGAVTSCCERHGIGR